MVRERETEAQGIGGEHAKNAPSGNVTSSLNSPPSQIVFSLPGTPHSQALRSRMPWAFLTGLAKKPKGWSLRHCFLGLVVSVAGADWEERSEWLAYRSSWSLFMHRDMF